MGGQARTGEVLYRSGRIGAVNVKLLATTAQTLVQGYGAGTFLEFLSIVLALKSGAEVLAETADNLAVYYTNESGAQLSVTIECTGFIDQSTNPITFAGPNTTEPIVTYANANNQALVLANPDDNFTGNASNDAVLFWKVAYRVHNFW